MFMKKTHSCILAGQILTIFERMRGHKHAVEETKEMEMAKLLTQSNERISPVVDEQICDFMGISLAEMLQFKRQ